MSDIGYDIESDDSDRTALKLAFISVRVKWVPSVRFFW